MGKKKTTAKARKDKYYHLAKETGYRARSAFKLLQLNKKFNFLQNSQVLVDLCAAPGGWLQVASEHMPMSSVIIGVDLVPIRPIPRCITFQDDITKESCRTQIKNELHKWKVDCFLHDGAPNVGKNWLHDAYSQSVLALHSLKLACDFLRKGGWFITKVFRSKDYQALMWVFNQLFDKVHATKPQASRNVSAEIFVVCQGFVSPDKIDKKFFDPKSVFQEVESKPREVNILDFEPKKKKKAKGYSEETDLLYKKVKVSEYLSSSSPLTMLSEINELVFDKEEQKENKFVTAELMELTKDIRSCGKKDIKALLKWHKKVNKAKPDAVETEDKESELDSEEEIERKLEEIQEHESKMMKKKKKSVIKERNKLRERMSNMAQSINAQDDMELFALDRVSSARKEAQVEEIILDEDEEIYSSEEGSDAESEDNMEEDQEIEDTDALIVGADLYKQEDLWFEKEIFKNIEEDDENNEVKNAEEFYKNKESEKPVENNEEVDTRSEIQKKIDAYDSDSDSDSDYEYNRGLTENPSSQPKRKKPKNHLEPEELALGNAIVTSNKRKREIIDASYNRNTFNDDSCDLPDWFIEDEKKRVRRDHLKPFVSSDLISYYKAKKMDINARTIKKVAEAKARKRRKSTKKLEKVRKQAEGISDTNDMSNKEKAAHIKGLYKKAGLLKKKKENTTYVFAKKGAGRKVKRPPGVSGKIRVVDKRMKKDLKGEKKRKR